VWTPRSRPTSELLRLRGKVTFQLTQKDQFIGYSQYGLKQKPNRGLSASSSPTCPLAGQLVLVHKAEWQRLERPAVHQLPVKHFGFGWPMVPKVDRRDPPRFDIMNNSQSGAGWNGREGPAL
jgi:hypothetical protein